VRLLCLSRRRNRRPANSLRQGISERFFYFFGAGVASRPDRLAVCRMLRASRRAVNRPSTDRMRLDACDAARTQFPRAAILRSDEGASARISLIVGTMAFAQRPRAFAATDRAGWLCTPLRHRNWLRQGAPGSYSGCFRVAFRGRKQDPPEVARRCPFGRKRVALKSGSRPGAANIPAQTIPA
jgi:hypothetical protein